MKTDKEIKEYNEYLSFSFTSIKKRCIKPIQLVWICDNIFGVIKAKRLKRY